MTGSSDASPNGARAAGWRRLAKRVGIDIRPGEEANACLLFLSFLLLFSFQYATKSIRQATFVHELGAEKLPYVYLLVALCSYPLLWLYGRIAERLSYHRLVAGTCAAVAVTLVAFWWLLRAPSSWATMVFYVWVAIVFALTVSQFWFLSSHVFDPRQARRLFGFIGAGALLGSVAGGQLARLATAVADTRSALLIAAVPIVLAAIPVLLIARLDPQRSRRRLGGSAEWQESRGGLEVLRRSRHLQLISLILVLGMIVGQIVDLQFNWAVQNATTELDERTGYFGNLYTIIGLSAFFFQLLLTSRIHQSLGVAAALKVLPLAMAVGAGGLLVAAALMPVLLAKLAQGLKIGENGLRYSLDQASRELLFLPVPAGLRIKAKSFIDVFVQRAGKGLAALVLLPVTFGVLTPVQMAWVSLTLALGWLILTRFVHHEYVRSFRWSLRERKVDTALPIKISDSTTLELLIQSLGSPDPRQVLNSLEVLSAHGRGNLVLPLLLHHDDGGVRRRTLEILADEGRRDAVPLIERRLRDREPEVRALAIRVLARLSGRDGTELMLPRLEEGNPEVRAAAVAYLINHGNEEQHRRAAQVLHELLVDDRPETRAEAAKALSSIPDPQFAEPLIRLLYDGDPRVAREAIHAVRQRLTKETKNPLYLPTLVSLLANRRLKHDARRALVAYGEQGIPALVHFMGDPDENLWVRRALPKAVARIGVPSAAAGLVDCLLRSRDPFQRRALIEALNSIGYRATGRAKDQVLNQAEREIRGYLTALRDLVSLGDPGRFRLQGPRLRWVDRDHDPDLLERLLMEALDDHVRNTFGLLATCHDPEHVWPAYSGLRGGRRAVRSHALELLDNTLSSQIRRPLFVVIDDLALDEKTLLAAELFGLRRRTRVETLRALLTADPETDREANLAAAAVYAIYTDRVSELYEPLVAVGGSRNEFVRETAAWATERLRAAAPG